MNRSSKLKARIAAAIAEGGTKGWLPAADGRKETVKCLAFERYMAMCLYDRDGGYYRSGEVRTGREGDFYTSSAVGTVMGDKLAGYMGEWIEAFGGAADAAEWGAGTGRLSQQITEAWRREGRPWLQGMTHFVIDGHPSHLAAAGARMADGEEPSVRFLTPEQADAHDWSARPVVSVANELLDAFPVHRVVVKQGELLELGVTCTGEGDFRYAYMPLSDPEIERSLRSDNIALREDQETEVNLNAERWLADLGGKITAGALILVDYGHEAAELTAAHRMRGTLLGYAGHRVSDDPFADPGNRDMTAHVNFSACRRAAEKAGWNVAYYETQKQFLVDRGALRDLTDHDGRDPFGEAARRNRTIRQLLLGDGMSEAFKVMTLVKRP